MLSGSEIPIVGIRISGGSHRDKGAKGSLWAERARLLSNEVSESCGHSRLDIVDRGGFYGEESTELYGRVSGRSGQAGIGSGILLAGASQRISVPQGTLANWVPKPVVGSPQYPWSVVAELEGENKQPRRELAQMRMERDFVKKPLRTLLCQGIDASCALMKAWRSQYPITVMAKVHGTLAVQQSCQRDTMENAINLMEIT